LEHLLSASLASVSIEMESQYQVALDSTNYFQWLSYIEDLLRSKGLYRIATAKRRNQRMKIRLQNGKIDKIKHMV